MRDRRRLAAIVAADVAGYSKLMRRDDSGTLSALKAHRRDVIDPKVAEYGGRVVKSIGDGLLMEFPSVVDATRCAVDVQRALAARNADVPADRRIAFRMGVNVGDVIIDGDDIFGDGVNVAARLEALAEPGGICVSRRVYEEVSGKVEAAFADRGLQRVKNIEPGVHVYALQLDGTTAASAGVATPAAEVSSLYGRADDVSALCALVAQKALVTVVGPAGVGKTRLAEAVAHASRNAFGDAVRVVELASLADPGLVPLTIARALDLVVGEPDAALDVLVQSLAGQRLLLVLDNCEHVLDEAGRIVDALRRGASGVHILITSQEVLRHVDEQVYRLSTLGLPE
jgi:class 3 adenylate cyclase